MLIKNQKNIKKVFSTILIIIKGIYKLIEKFKIFKQIK